MSADFDPSVFASRFSSGPLRGTISEPSLELVPRRGQEENRHAIWLGLSNLLGALPVDLEDDVIAVGKMFLDLRTTRAVVIVEDERGLK